MPVEQVETLIIGGGQAGLAMSAHLRKRGLSHLVVERDRIAERWRTCRWDSLVANGPSWHDRFPDLSFEGVDPYAFATKDRIVDYFEEFARRIEAPLRTGVTVTALTRDGDGYLAETTAGTIRARNVVAATGPFQTPIIPPIVPREAGVMQIHSADYRNPGQLPDGAVLVVGAGSSGVQIADELLRAGRKVYLAVGPHDRPPIRYRGRDFVWWLGVLGKWNMATPGPGTEHVTIAVSGAQGGRTVDFRELAARGVILTGRAERFADGRLQFAADLAENIAAGDASYLSMLEEADAYLAANGIDLPEERSDHPDRVLAHGQHIAAPGDGLDQQLADQLVAQGIAQPFHPRRPAASSQSASDRPEITASICAPVSTSSSIRASASTDRVSSAASVSWNSRSLM
jgi:putative flavoprotein involved in K+ transport